MSPAGLACLGSPTKCQHRRSAVATCAVAACAVASGALLHQVLLEQVLLQQALLQQALLHCATSSALSVADKTRFAALATLPSGAQGESGGDAIRVV